MGGRKEGSPVGLPSVLQAVGLEVLVHLGAEFHFDAQLLAGADALERPRVVVELATDLLTDPDLEDGFVRSAATAFGGEAGTGVDLDRSRASK